MSIRQQEDVTLRSYIARFNNEAFLINEADDKILVVAFTNKNDLKTMSDVLYRATMYMNVEDALLACEEKPKKRDRQEEARQDKGRKMARMGDKRND